MGSKVYEKITNEIIKKLEQGVIPWACDWQPAQNLRTKHRYTGVNRLLLSGEGTFFLTMRQVNEMGGNVKKGSRGYPVIYMAPYVKKDAANSGNESEEVATERNTEASARKSRGTVMRYYTVFKIEDVEGLEAPEFPEVGARPEAEDIVKGYQNPPTIFHKGSQPCYIRSIDAIEMPDRNFFKDSEAYYGTLFHELGHSTGATHRLNREEMSHSLGFGSTNYAKEELIAELTSAFLCQECGIEKRIDNQAAYIQNWLKALRNDRKIVINAASQAERAADYILKNGLRQQKIPGPFMVDNVLASTS